MTKRSGKENKKEKKGKDRGSESKFIASIEGLQL